MSWTSERADTLFVRERVRKAAAHKRQPQRAQRARETEGAEAFFLGEGRRRRQSHSVILASGASNPTLREQLRNWAALSSGHAERPREYC
jgi:hypothetical protein